MKKEPKKPWKPENVVEQPVQENDPSLEEIRASLLRTAGGKHSVARQQRKYHRHLSPKAKARKKVRRRLRKNARKQNPSNRGKSQGGSK